MQFDRYSIALLIHRPDGPQLDAKQAADLQDAHMSYLLDLHEAGHLLVAGPVDDKQVRGLSILNVGTEQARELKELDPAVRAGVYSIRVLQWVVPAGAMRFTHARFPRSMAEALEEPTSDRQLVGSDTPNAQSWLPPA
jgi:uncharacterized protein